jgi:hypothetical protein
LADLFDLQAGAAGFPAVAFSAGFFTGCVIISLIWRLHQARLLLVGSSLLFMATQACLLAFHTALPAVLSALYLMGLGAGLLHPSMSSLFG